MFYSTSGWVHNKKEKDVIVYAHNGDVVRITVEMFIKAGHTTEEFLRIKAESDAMYHAEDNLDVAESRRTEPLDEAEQTGKCSAKSPEDLIVERIDRQTHQAYLESLKPLANKALGKLTVVQRRRYLLHVCERLSTRRIAEIEGATQQSVVDSLHAADKKIKKYFEEGQKQPKTPCQK